jgi:hypothetical protein
VRAGSWPTSESRRAEPASARRPYKMADERVQEGGPASARRPYKMADERVQEGGARLGEEAV